MVFWKRGERIYLADTEWTRYEMVIDSPEPADDVSVFWIKKETFEPNRPEKTCQVLQITEQSSIM